MGHPFDLAATDKLLTTTRSVRRRLDLARPVNREVVLDCIRIAQQAPTGGNLQGWRFVVVTDAGKRARLAEIYCEVAEANLRRGRDAASEAQTRRVYESALYLTEILARVPVHVIPCLRGRPVNNSNAMAAGFYASIIPAAWSFMLALRSRGLGSVWTTATLARETEVAQLLRIHEDVTQIGLIPVAYYTGTDFSPAVRPPPETITYWDEWGAG